MKTNNIPMYARDLGILLVNKTTNKYMSHGMFLRAVDNLHIVIIPDGVKFFVALSEDFSKLYKIVDIAQTLGE